MTNDNQSYSKDEEERLQAIYLRQKFSELSNTLEEGVASLVGKYMKDWRENNLPILNGNKEQFISNTESTTSLSTTKRALKDGQLPSRIFVSRPSLLTELLTISHIRSIYNIFVAILFLLFMNKTVEEIIRTGRIDFGLTFLTWVFGKFDCVIMIWLCMKLSTLILVYLCFHHWAHHRYKSKRFYDTTACFIFLFYLIAFLHIPIQSLLSYQLPPGSSIIILCEQVRLFMKTWAFVRSNVNRALMFKKDDSSSSKSPCSDFSQYIYFLFIPTLVYRDEYPRNEYCNWTKVAVDFGQVFGCILCSHFLLARFCYPIFGQFGKGDFTKNEFMMAVFSSCFPASMIFLCGFFCLLHAWMNAFAEMMCFADRLFYKDWWNSTSYPRFYRTWNCVVHDWLYEYVYKELSELQLKGRRIYKCLPMLVVFFISAVVHEYILAFTFRFFYPVLLVMFGGFGVLLMFFNTRAKLFNIFIWMSLILGTGILMCLYSIEWYARINCPPIVDGLADYFIPRSWFCYGQTIN